MLKRITDLHEIEKLRKDLNAKRSERTRCVTLCSGTGCLAAGTPSLVDAFRKELMRQGLADKILIRQSGCYGFCELGPVVVILPEKICYFKVKTADVLDIVNETLQNGRSVERLLYKDPVSEKRISHFNEIPFYSNQYRLLLEENTEIDPKNIEDYIAIGGYSALAKVLGKMKPQDVISEIKKSGLRGRGGGGFPTGKKWESVHEASGDVKYVIVNGDEGDPGAYMDRSILEGNPHRVLEGLIIGAFAIGAKEGFVYVRQEYPLAVENTKVALAQAREMGILGENIMGTGFNFDVTVHCGAGAFVSGESSALMNAIEGRVGEPRPKYIHTSESGLWGKPSCLNNVETWANVPTIINRGADWYAKIGTENSKGTKIFSLVGKINNSGLVEVPMGTTMREIIYKIGGGIPNKKNFKAVQTGGPSGGVITEKNIDLRVDFDELDKAGSMMGSGGIIVMDEDTCMVDVARYYTEFLAGESCGKCVPCREGLRQMLNILNRITRGEGKSNDIDLLLELSDLMSVASLCSLGKTAANPVLSTIKNFRKEFEEHIFEKHCSTGMCKALVRYEIVKEDCNACGLCIKHCPVGAIAKSKDKTVSIDQSKCIKCKACVEICKNKKKPIHIIPIKSISGQTKTAGVSKRRTI